MKCGASWGASHEFTHELNTRLEEAQTHGSPSPLTATNVRESALSYLTLNDEEIARLGKDGRPHRNLVMSDERIDDAIFVIYVFHDDAIELFVGRGNAHDVREFGEKRLYEVGDRLSDELHRRFEITTSELRIDRRDAEAWLGRSWECS